MKKYWKRFLSNKPKALKKLQKILGSVSAGLASIAAGLLVYDEMKMISIVCGIISIILGGVCTGLQFATSDKELQNQ